MVTCVSSKASDVRIVNSSFLGQRTLLCVNQLVEDRHILFIRFKGELERKEERTLIKSVLIAESDSEEKTRNDIQPPIPSTDTRHLTPDTHDVIWAMAEKPFLHCGLSGHLDNRHSGG